ncbi:hypothetical protein HK097_004104 [Rhizophlyctis rosea]|uniref:Uncharacterized protein n=1 Tax=Rhizophlyctis rosea TaxID=64517 RepID=A0AAD5WZ87_9FUNG|nr:hypothetical protein HK097_004104 [Rhizophlyctis rosea]
MGKLITAVKKKFVSRREEGAVNATRTVRNSPAHAVDGDSRMIKGWVTDLEFLTQAIKAEVGVRLCAPPPVPTYTDSDVEGVISYVVSKQSLLPIPDMARYEALISTITLPIPDPHAQIALSFNTTPTATSTASSSANPPPPPPPAKPPSFHISILGTIPFTELLPYVTKTVELVTDRIEPFVRNRGILDDERPRGATKLQCIETFAKAEQLQKRLAKYEHTPWEDLPIQKLIH